VSTVFEISEGTAISGVLFVSTLLGLGLFSVGVGLLIYLRRSRPSVPFDRRVVRAGLLAGVALFLTLVSFALWRGAASTEAQYLAEYRSGRARVVDGTVHVLSEQSAHGRSPGDLVRVAGHGFEIDYFDERTPGYHLTVAHGGALREGVHARITYSGRVILKVEVGQGDSPSEGPDGVQVQ